MVSDDPESLVAVVLAGGGLPAGFVVGEQVATKALVPVAGGKAMASYVLEALLHSSSVATTVYLGPLAAGLPGIDRALPAGRRLVDTLALGLGAALAEQPGRILVSTADIPWLTGDAVDRFLATAPAADLVYPIVPEEAARAQFPDHRRTFVRTRSGRYTGGNLVLLTPQVVPSLLVLADRVIRARKNPFALSTLFGFGVVVDFLLGRLAVSQVERRASRILGFEVRALVTEDAALAADVDRPEHLPTSVPVADRAGS